MFEIQPESIDAPLSEDTVSKHKWKIAIRKVLRAKDGGDRSLEGIDTLRDLPEQSLDQLAKARGIGRETILDLSAIQQAVTNALLDCTGHPDQHDSAYTQESPVNDAEDASPQEGVEPLIDYPTASSAGEHLLARFFAVSERLSVRTLKSRLAADRAALTEIDENTLRALDAILSQELGETTQTDASLAKEDQTYLFEVKWERPIEFAELAVYDRKLALSIDEYLESLKTKNIMIMEARLGIGTPAQTLEALGRELGVTRERVRQIQKKGMASLLSFLRNCGFCTWELFRHCIEDPAATFPKTAAAFYDRQNFYEFLTFLSGFDFTLAKGADSIPTNDINRWMANFGHPIKLKDFITDYHERNSSFRKKVALMPLAILESERYTVRNGFVYVHDAPREHAVAATLLSFPKGLHFSDAANITNKEIYERGVLRADRLDRPFSDSEYIYTCEQGTYKHTKFLGISGADIKRVCEAVLDSLLDAEEEVVHLGEIYHDSDFLRQFHYFDARYVTKWYGKDWGIHFFGKSRKDNVSLDPEAVPYGQAQTVERILSNADEPVSVTEIADHLKSRSVRHANLYLHELIEGGRAVAVAPRFYWSLDKALSGIGENVLEGILLDILEKKRLPMHTGLLADEVSQRCEKAIGVPVVSSFVKKLRKEGLVEAKLPVCSMHGIPFDNLADLAEDIFEIASELQAFTKEISRHIAIAPEAAARLRHRIMREMRP